METSGLPLRHFLIALLVVAIWGTNFVVIRVALDDLPPLLFAALRFTFAVLPAIFFVPRPRVGWRSLAAYGLFIGAGQFGLLFIAMNGHISPGLASLVVQCQVFFTIAMSIRLAGEAVRPFQWAALALGAAGIGVIAANTGGSTTALGIALVIAAGFFWAAGNMVAKASGVANMLSYVVWASLFSAPPLFALSLLFEGWPAIGQGLSQAGTATWLAVLWQAVGNTLFGYAAWGWLLARHPAAVITPTALLVPIFGMGASFLWLGEPLPFWKLGAAALVIGGLALGILYPRWRKAIARAAR
ncbi:EamA family transporter [Aureimonas mangrovi]|uniref:EamA family transporter n=1 Tax=Aureimonas mangrovi TaxID=2758041 RepID=UPI00163DA064|nr:EamA family transporter [Aureimonas mangrovi]